MSTNFMRYQIGMRNFLDTLGKKHPMYLKAINYQSQLLENIKYVESYGDSENYRSTRNKIIDSINELALETINKTFNELSNPSPIIIEQKSPSFQERIWREFQEPEMSFISPEPFIMGSRPPALDAGALEDEQPLHVVNLDAYYIAITSVTNIQYAIFTINTGHNPPDFWQNSIPPQAIYNHPVVDVSWEDAIKFCNWLRGLTKEHYRLPTEAEWEKAARGVNGQIFPWGNEWKDDYANTNEYNRHKTGYKTVAVNEFPEAKSHYNILNMAGNVFEWTSSLWGNDNKEPQFLYPYNPKDGREAIDAPSHILRIIRGGSFSSQKRTARCAYRDKLSPKKSRKDVGFRLALSKHNS
ncbi:MAG: formylglycine-generating enzyme family protein [Calothrix sp. FI2-JRJ7]|nr:formylglycine-generating enzyme family protein [Calothrix sp. FI2-JRJ7]